MDLGFIFFFFLFPFSLVDQQKKNLGSLGNLVEKVIFPRGVFLSGERRKGGSFSIYISMGPCLGPKKKKKKKKNNFLPSPLGFWKKSLPSFCE